MLIRGLNYALDLRKTTAKLLLVALLCVDGFFIALPLPSEAVTQNAARWRNDDGTETSATWAAAENAAITTDKGVTKRLRFGLANGGSDTQLKQKAMTEFQDGEDFIQTSVIDSANGFAYFATGTRQAKIVKVNLASFTRVGTLALESVKGGGVYGMAIDTTNGFLYAAISDVPSRIVKVNLASFTVTSSLTLQAGDDYAYAAALDIAANVGYFATYTTPSRIVKVNLATMTRVGSLTLDSGEGPVIEQANLAFDSGTSALYVTFSNANPAKVVKVSASTFTRVGALTFLAGEVYGRDIVIDAAAGFGYVSTNQRPAKILKFSLSSFTRVAALALGVGNNNGMEMEMDTTGGNLYVGLSNIRQGDQFGLFPGKLAKVSLASFTRTAVVTWNAGEDGSAAMIVDASAGKGYVASPWVGTIVKFDLSPLARNSALAAATRSDVGYMDGQLDASTGMAYFCAANMPGAVLKVNAATMARVDALHMDPGEEGCYSVALDTANNFGYAVLWNFPSKIVKFNLTTMARISTLTLSDAVNNADASAIDTTNGFLYVATYQSPAKIVKVDLSTFTETAVLTLNSGENAAWISTEIDVANQKLYVGTNTVPGKVVKVNLASFTREAVVAFNSGEDYAIASGIDLADQKMYVTTDTNPGIVVKINLSTFTRESALTLNSGERYSYTGELDAARDLFYIATGSYNAQPRVTQVNVANMTRITAFETADADEHGVPGIYDAFAASVIDTTNGYAYFMTEYIAPSRLYKLSILPRYELRLEHTKKVSTCAAATGWAAVGAGTWEPANSSYLTDGAATTNVASGVTDGGSSFVAGQVKDAGSQAGEVLLDGSTEFTEVEYAVRATVAAENGATYCFRLTDAGSATGFTFTNYAEATLSGTFTPTSSNRVTLSRLQAGVPSVATATFTLAGTLSGTLTVTFPAGFTVTSAATGPASSGCLSGFSFTSSTLTATKTSCSGTIVLGGATVMNPVSPGTYHVSWINDDPGGGDIVIVDSDQVTVSGTVDPQMTFNAGSQTAACDGAFSGSGGGLSLGTLTIAAVATSDVSSVPHVCTRVTINGSGGAVVTVRSANAALRSTSTPADQITSASATLVAATAGYGVCVGSGGGDTGRDATAPAGALPSAAAPFNGTCSTSGHAVGALTTSAQNLWSVSGTSQNAFARVYVKAAVSPATPAHADYADTLMFIGTGTY